MVSYHSHLTLLFPESCGRAHDQMRLGKLSHLHSHTFTGLGSYDASSPYLEYLCEKFRLYIDTPLELSHEYHLASSITFGMRRRTSAFPNFRVKASLVRKAENQYSMPTAYLRNGV